MPFLSSKYFWNSELQVQGTVLALDWNPLKNKFAKWCSGGLMSQILMCHIRRVTHVTKKWADDGTQMTRNECHVSVPYGSHVPPWMSAMSPNGWVSCASALRRSGFFECFSWKSTEGRSPESDVATICHIVDVSWKEGWHVSRGNGWMMQPNDLEWMPHVKARWKPLVSIDECHKSWWMSAKCLRHFGLREILKAGMNISRSDFLPVDVETSHYFRTLGFGSFWTRAWISPKVTFSWLMW